MAAIFHQTRYIKLELCIQLACLVTLPSRLLASHWWILVVESYLLSPWWLVVMARYGTVD